VNYLKVQALSRGTGIWHYSRFDFYPIFWIHKEKWACTRSILCILLSTIVCCRWCTRFSRHRILKLCTWKTMGIKYSWLRVKIW